MNETKSLYERIGGHDGLAKLLHHFYADVRQHKIIGPIFNERIHDWLEHLATIENFWARQTGGPSNYGGGMGKHLSLPLEPEHFSHWLALWEFNCRKHLPSAEADEMILLAHQIAGHLQRIVFGRAGLEIS
jgi:hemoglobin